MPQAEGTVHTQPTTLWLSLLPCGVFISCNVEPFLQTRLPADYFTCVLPVNPFQHLMRLVYLVPILQMRKLRLRAI